MPLTFWATHVLQWSVTKRGEAVRWSKPQKPDLSSDCGLQLAHMKTELLVIANQHVAVNAFPGLVHTARHTTRVVCTRSRRPNREGGGAEGVEGEGGEVVTR